jgi:hypothetical protein
VPPPVGQAQAQHFRFFPSSMTMLEAPLFLLTKVQNFHALHVFEIRPEEGPVFMTSVKKNFAVKAEVR